MAASSSSSSGLYGSINKDNNSEDDNNSIAEEESQPLIPSSTSAEKSSSSISFRRKSASSPPPGSSLFSSSSKGKKNDDDNDKSNGSSNSNSRGLLVNRFLILLALVGVVSVGVYYQHKMTTLNTALQQEHERVDQLQSTLQQHEQVIERFNTSVTNSDVIERLSLLEDNLQNTSSFLQDELSTVRADVKKRLNETLKELSHVVRDAEDQIQNQVSTVKTDLDAYIHTTQDQFSMENSFMVYQLAGTFTLLSCLISMWHITAHLRRMNQPTIQRKILAILWMSPIYAVTSWFSLVFHSAEGYLAIIKDGYEAYIIYQFLSFLIAVLGKGDRQQVVDLLAKRADHLTPPFTLCFWRKRHYENNHQLANEILLQCQFFALQFVLFRPLTTTAMVVLEKLDYYGPVHEDDGDDGGDNDDGSNMRFNYQSPQAYITIIQNLSIFIAFAGLLKFYHAVDKDLAWCRPFAKFCCIKGVVFMTFWQGLAISLLAEMTDVGGGQEEEWAKSAQNFLICLEMLLFSIAHFYCFPTEEWEEGYRVKHIQGQFGDTMALGDFLADIKLIVTSRGGGGGSGSKKKRKKSMIATVATPGRPASIPENGSGNDDSTELLPEECDDDESDDSSVDPLALQQQPAHDEENQALLVKKTATLSTTKKGSAAADAADHYQRYNGSFGDMEDMDDDQRFVAMQLEKSLGVELASDDPDIAEATKRLLASHVLDPSFFADSITASGADGAGAASHGLLTDEMRQWLRENALEDAYSECDDDEEDEEEELAENDDRVEDSASSEGDAEAASEAAANNSDCAKKLFRVGAAEADTTPEDIENCGDHGTEKTCKDVSSPNAEDGTVSLKDTPAAIRTSKGVSKTPEPKTRTSPIAGENHDRVVDQTESGQNSAVLTTATTPVYQYQDATNPTGTTSYPLPGSQQSTPADLRPSIFTTVASLVEKEVEAEEKKEKIDHEDF